MTRMIRSSVFLAVCLGLWSCTSDPTADEAGVPTAIAANPTVAFVNQGASTLIKFGLMDELGGLVPSTWSIGSVSPEFTVTFDSTYRVVYNPDGTLVLPDNQSEIRVTVTGVSAGAGSFTVSASGITKTITVSVVPTDVPATFNTTTPDIGEDLVLTMPAGIVLQDTATFATPAGAPIVISRAADGTSVTLQVAPGTNSPIQINGVRPTWADLNLALATTQTITANNVSPYPGSDATATAPTITLPAVGGSFTWYDLAQTSPQYYKFTVADTTTLTTTINWQDDSGDIDVAWYTAAGAFLGYFGAGTGAKPEHSTHTFAPGSYLLGPEVYDGGAGDWYLFTIEVVSTP